MMLKPIEQLKKAYGPPERPPLSFRPSRSHLAIIPPALQACQSIQVICGTLLLTVQDASQISEAMQSSLSILRQKQAAAIANLPSGPDDPDASSKTGTALLSNSEYITLNQFFGNYPQSVNGEAGWQSPADGLVHQFPTKSSDVNPGQDNALTFKNLEYLETDFSTFSSALQQLDDRLSSLRQSIQQTFNTLNQGYNFAQAMVSQILESNHTQFKKILGIG